MNHEAIEVADPVTALAQSLDGAAPIVLTQAAQLARGEVEAQMAAAHQFPRSVSRFLREAQGLATLSVEVAESCIYTLPRGGKPITGPSVRLAEIVASSYGNIQVAARIVAVEDTEIVAQGMAWDVEKNLRCVVETRRRITDRNGRRYNEDMITMTGNAAASIALRNAIFRVVPRAYVDSIFSNVQRTAVGDAKTLAARRGQVLDRLGKMGIMPDRILAKLGRHGIDDIGAEDLEMLIGWGTAAKNGDATLDELFPPTESPIAAAPEGRRVSLRRNGSAPEAAPATRQPGEDDD